MISWNVEQVSENVQVYSLDKVRNSILCSFDSFDEVVRVCNELKSTIHYKVVCDISCPSNKLYVADNEGYVTIYEVEIE
jgi:hypothetical protein